MVLTPSGAKLPTPGSLLLPPAPMSEEPTAWGFDTPDPKRGYLRPSPDSSLHSQPKVTQVLNPGAEASTKPDAVPAMPASFQVPAVPFVPSSEALPAEVPAPEVPGGGVSLQVPAPAKVLEAAATIAARLTASDAEKNHLRNLRRQGQLAGYKMGWEENQKKKRDAAERKQKAAKKKREEDEKDEEEGEEHATQE